jgi:UDP-N-acetylmuramate dehydrogenase
MNQSAVINQDTLKGELLRDEPLAHYTTWRVGGAARLLYKPADMDDLANFLQQCPVNEPMVWIGLGSNSLIKDGGFAGIVVITQNCLNNLTQIAEDLVRVEAGVSCAKMARFCTRQHLTGGEFWAGIPGTMGGALRMNAGCFHKETWESVVEVETINRLGERRVRQPSEFKIAYRSALGLEPDEWFVAATCRLIPGDQVHSAELIKELLAHRAATQPTNEFNCGSVFRNPPNQFAAKLIESCGLKGHQIGEAMVSQKHANFIINHAGKASAKDIEQLIDFVRQTVYAKTGIELIQEVHVIGEELCPT